MLDGDSFKQELKALLHKYDVTLEISNLESCTCDCYISIHSNSTPFDSVGLGKWCDPFNTTDK